MPNGGSDCCGTCWFNSVNGGRPGYSEQPGPGPARCTIRADLEIGNPFWTYCANHPHHNPRQVRTPVGPVYVCDDYPYDRRPWVPSPDTPEVRAALVGLIESIPQEPKSEYPSATQFDEEVIRQLAAFKEPLAVAGLRRILAFDPDARARPAAGTPDEVILGGPVWRDRRRTLGQAVLALATILGDGAVPEIRRYMRFGLDLPDGAERYVSVRFLAVYALKHCTREGALPLLDAAARDPHKDVASLAQKMITDPADVP